MSTLDSIFDLDEANETDILKILKTIKSNTIGVYSISLDMRRMTLPSSLQSLVTMVNTSINTSTYLTPWQHATVRPLLRNQTSY